MQRLASIFKVRPEEGRLVLLLGIMFLCIQAGQGMGDNAASALFFLRFGVDFLPYMYLILGGMTFLLTLAYSAGLGRFERSRFFQALLLGMLLLLLVERVALLRPFSLLYPMLWLTVSCMGMILGTFTWNLAGEVSDARQAKRLFPLFTSAGILGSVLGNSITGFAAKLLGTDNLLIFFAGLLGVCYFLTRAVSRKYLHISQSDGKSAGLLNDLRSGFDFVRGSALMKLVAYASVLFSILFFAIAFPFSKVVTASFPDEAGVAGFLGLFSGITTAVTFIVSLFLANRVYGRLGIVNSVLLMPLIYLFGFVVFAAQYSLNGAIIARFAQLVILSGVAGTAWSALFNVVPSQKRGQVLAFENGVPSQVGVALSGLLLILGERVLTTTQIFFMGILVTLVCGGLVWKMRSAYGQALVDALKAGRLEVFTAEGPGFTGLQGDAAALNVLQHALRDSKPTTRRLAAEILGKMQNKSAIPALVDQLRDADSTVRAAAICALGELRAAVAVEQLLSALDDADSEVRGQALAAMTSIGVQASPALLAKLELLLDDTSLHVRSRAAIMLAKAGRREISISSLKRWLQGDDLSLRVAALETFGPVLAVDGHVGSPLQDAAPVLASIKDPSVAIRVAACRALGHVSDPACAQALSDSLRDPDAAVRQIAAQGLRQQGPEAGEFALRVLDSEDELARDAALDALAPGEAYTSDRLRSFAQEEIKRLRSLKIQAASLPSNGRASALLCSALQHKVKQGERRLVQIVGLIGNPRAMELVRMTMGGSDPESRAAALEALETLGDKTIAHGITSLLEEEPAKSSTEAAIETILRSTDRWMRALAIRAALELGLKDLILRLSDLKSDPDPLVRETADRALIQFGEVNSMDTLQTVSTLERVLLLREVPIFSDLSSEDLGNVAEIAREQWFPNNTAIFHEGEKGDMMFIIVSGHLHVVRSANGQDQVLAQRGPGDFVGEMAIIESAPRSATLLTQSDVRVLALEGESFKGILRERPEVSLAVLRSVSRRLREMAG